MENEVKYWFQSKTLQGLALKIIGIALVLGGVTGDDYEQIMKHTESIVGSLVVVGGGVMIIWGRLKASKQIKFRNK